MALDEDDLVRSVIKQSLFEFTREFWSEVVPEASYVPNWHIKYVCDSIQEEVELILAGKPKRYDYIIINMPPVTLKSVISNVMLNGWLWARAPHMSFIGCAYSQDAILKIARKANDLIKSDKYQRVFPCVRIRGDMDAVGAFGTTAGGIRFSVGMQGSITSKHGHVVVVDDPLNPQEARSVAETLQAKRIIFETLPNRKKDVKITPTFVIMQRLSEDDPSGDVLALAKEGRLRVKYICLPAEDQEWVNPPELRKYYRQQRGLLFPARLDEQVLAEFKVSGEYFYAGQYDQRPVPAGGGMFKTDCLVRDKECPDPANPKLWVKQVRYWDKAGTQKGGCFTVGVRMGKDLDGRFWVIHVDRFQKEASGREARIKEVAGIDREYVVVGVEQEPGSGGKESAANTVRNLAGFRVVKDVPTGDKTARADVYATQVNGGNVYLAREGIIDKLPEKWWRAYIEEVMLFWFGKYKDQVDSSSGAFKVLTGNNIRFGFYRRSSVVRRAR